MLLPRNHSQAIQPRCVLSEPRDTQWMQNIAREMHLSETAEPAGLRQALGASPRYIGRDKFGYLAELGSGYEIRGL